MVNLYVASIEPYSGKTSLCLALGLHYKAKGLKVKYMKPVDITGVKGGRSAGLDAAFVRQELGLTDPAEWLSPILLGPDTWEEALKAPPDKWKEEVLQAYQSLSKDCDLMILGGDHGYDRWLRSEASCQPYCGTPRCQATSASQL